MGTTRRDFVKTSLAVAGFSGFAFRGPPIAIKKGLVFDMVFDKRSYADRFKLVRDTGFEVVHALTELDTHNVAVMKEASDVDIICNTSVMRVDIGQCTMD